MLAWPGQKPAAVLPWAPGASRDSRDQYLIHCLFLRKELCWYGFLETVDISVRTSVHLGKDYVYCIWDDINVKKPQG